MHRLGPDSRLMDNHQLPGSAGAGAKKRRTGVCRICGCTDDRACVDDSGLPCVWVDADHTLCDNLECIAQVPMDELEQMKPNWEVT